MRRSSASRGRTRRFPPARARASCAERYALHSTQVWRGRVDGQFIPEAVGEALWIDKSAEPVAEPGIHSRPRLLEEEVDLHGAVAEADEGVRRLPRHLVKAAQPAAAEPGRLGELWAARRSIAAGLGDQQVDVGALVSLAASKRTLRHQRPHPLIPLGPAPGGLHYRLMS